MLLGTVNNFHEATIRIVIAGPAGETQEVEAVIDTGFTAYLSLPPQLVAQLQLRFRGRGRALLADGSETIFDAYEAEVVWDDKPRRVGVDEADTDALVGMSLLYHHKLTIEVVAGGKVVIQPLTM